MHGFSRWQEGQKPKKLNVWQGGEDYETCSYEEVVNRTYLEEWALMDCDYFSSLLGATEALKASTLRLPIVGGAKAMGSSICLLLSKVGDVNSLVSELGNIRVKDCALLHQCKDLLSTIAVMQLKPPKIQTRDDESVKLSLI